MPVIDVIDKETGEVVSTYRAGAAISEEEIEKLMADRHDPETQLWKTQGEPEFVEVGNDEVSTGVQSVLDAEEEKRKLAEAKAEAERKKAEKAAKAAARTAEKTAGKTANE